MSYYRFGLLVAAFGMGMGCVLTTPPAQAHVSRATDAATPAVVTGGATQVADGEGGAPTQGTPKPQFS